MNCICFILFVCLLRVADAALHENSVSTECENGCRESVEDSRSMRLEYIKSQILRKLKLKCPPSITAPPLPEFLKQQLLLDVDEDEEKENFTREDFFGKTHRVTIFSNTTFDCYHINNTNMQSCHQFLLTQDLSTRCMISADLWMYVPSNSTECTVINVIPGTVETKEIHQFLISNNSLNGTSRQWMKLDWTVSVRTWLRNGHFEFKLMIICNNEPLQAPPEKEEPFLIIRTNPKRNSRTRRKRFLDCSPNTTACCKAHFHVNFKEIGWHQWIQWPDSYDANYCHGECSLERSAARYHHTSVLQEYLQSGAAARRNFSIPLCCSPVRLSPLTMIYMTEERHVYSKVLPNMIAESCDCA